MFKKGYTPWNSQPKASSKDKVLSRIPLTKGKFSLVDKEDFDFINQWKWSTKTTGDRFYARRIEGVGSAQKVCYMARIIMRAKKGEYVDHINGDTLDNRRSNLRVCTNAQNVRNSRVAVGNKYGYKGIYKTTESKINPWVARITVNYKSIHIGVFPTPEEAALAYNEAAIKYFGDFARLNRMTRGEQHGNK